MLARAVLEGTRTAKKRRRRPEQAVQQMLFKALGFMLPRESLMIHVPNGGYRPGIEGAIFQGQGVLAGMTDIVVFWDGRAFCMEVKAGKGALSNSQVAAHSRLRAAGCPVAVVRSLQEAIAFLRENQIPLRIKGDCT